MRTGKGNAIQYGKISLASDSEDMASLVETLKKILQDVKYPESSSEVDEEIEKAQKELEEEFKNGGENKVSSTRKEAELGRKEIL